MSEKEFEKQISEIVNEIRDVLVDKNKRYGNSFYEGLDEVKELYKRKEIHYLSFFVREKDKLNRIKYLISSNIEQKDKKDAIFDAVLDLVGYGILFLNYMKNYE